MTMIRLLEAAAAVPTTAVQRIVPTYKPGCYVAAYDPERGLASLVCTTDRKMALDLAAGDAIRLWRSSPSSEPLRDDGRPNRPLTAFTVEFA
jgi:hypothetical protein